MIENTNENNEQKEQEEFTKKIYTDKASKLLKWVFGILIFDFITYILFGFLGYFDFGVFFEIVTFIFVIKSKNIIKEQSIDKAKTNIIIAMIPVGWLLIYDLIDLFSHLGQIIEELISYYSSLDFFFYEYSLDLIDIPLLLIMLLLFLSYTSLCKATGDSRYKQSTDWFYDKK